MSRHNRILENGRMLTYGLDKATGGFFWQVFFTGEEIDSFEDGFDSEVYAEKDGLSLTALIGDIESFNNKVDNLRDLIDDWYSEPYPTGLQIHIGAMFNKDIESMLAEVGYDVIKCLADPTQQNITAF